MENGTAALVLVANYYGRSTLHLVARKADADGIDVHFQARTWVALMLSCWLGPESLSPSRTMVTACMAAGGGGDGMRACMGDLDAKWQALRSGRQLLRPDARCGGV